MFELHPAAAVYEFTQDNADVLFDDILSTQEESAMKRLVRPLTVAISVSAILLLLSCAQQGEIKEPFEIRKVLDSSDYQGEILPFKEPVVIKRLAYELGSTTTKRKNTRPIFPLSALWKVYLCQDVLPILTNT